MANRNINSPSHIYGIRPGFNIADLAVPYGSPVHAITDATTTTTSDAIDNGWRSMEVIVTFAKTNTTCDVIIKDTAGSPNIIASLLGVNVANANSQYVGGYEGLTLGAAPFTVTVQNIQNASNINVYVKKTS